MSHTSHTKKTFTIMAYTQGARWQVASGFASRESASRALEALLAKDGQRAPTSSGSSGWVSCSFGIVEED